MCVRKRDPTVLYNLVSWSDIICVCILFLRSQSLGAAHIPGEEVSKQCEQEEGGSLGSTLEALLTILHLIYT